MTAESTAPVATYREGLTVREKILVAAVALGGDGPLFTARTRKP